MQWMHKLLNDLIHAIGSDLLYARVRTTAFWGV